MCARDSDRVHGNLGMYCIDCISEPANQAQLCATMPRSGSRHNPRDSKQYWTIGHKRPVRDFDLANDDAFRACFALENLMVQEAHENYADRDVFDV